jgi:predicted permease
MFNALLRLYPASFRQEYGAEMRADFQQRSKNSSGMSGRLALWISLVFDTLFNATAVHWDILRQDLRYTWRSLRRSPGFALMGVLVIALGIGATTAAFSVTDYVLLRPLPYRNPDRLVKLWENLPNYSRIELSPANFRDWKRASHSFEAMGSFHEDSTNLVGQGNPERLEGTATDSELLPMLGVQPLLGRLFAPEDDRAGAAGTVILSHSLWQNIFGGDQRVVGRKVIFNDEPYTVIGVMPAAFKFPNRETEYWVPTRYTNDDYGDRNNNYLQALGRLKPGVSVEQARADLAVVSAQLERQYPKENEKTGANVLRLRDELSQQSRMLLLALCGAALCVLLITCANLANLLLARALARQKELAVRAALGAGRERMIRQMLTESLTLAALGGAFGILIAIAATPLLSMLVPNRLPTAEMPVIDLRMLLVAVALTTITGLLFGIVPALRVSGKADLAGLREGARSGGLRKERLRSALVVGEVAASVILLVSAGLLLRALWNVQGRDPGFRSNGVLTMRTALPVPKYDPTLKRNQFYDRVLSEVRQLPGVKSEAYISFLPMVMRGGIWPVSVNGEVNIQRSLNTASLRYVTPGFFQALDIPLHLGRDVSEADTADKPFVAVVSESFAKRYWPNENAIGHHFQFAFADRTIIGVVGDIRVRGLEEKSEPQVYLSSKQVPDGSISYYTPKDMVIRASGDVTALVPAVREIVHRADPEQPISNVRTMSEIVEDETASRSVQVRVLGTFAGLAFVLAAVGIYGLLSFTVSQRDREIGVRMALGAQGHDIFRMVLKQGVRLTLVGIVPGILLAYFAGRTMQALLAGVTPRDPMTFGTATAVCAVMALIGAFFPALRAMRVDPVKVMRAE